MIELPKICSNVATHIGFVIITIMIVLRALLSFEARVFSFAARLVIYARREEEDINETEGC